MTTRLAMEPVTDCDDCPFARFDESACLCVLSVDDLTSGARRVYLYEETPTPPLPPEWCPLRRGHALIELKTKETDS